MAEPVGARGPVLQLPLATGTLPPHLHTNCYIIHGGGEAWVVDPGAGDPTALAPVAAALADLGRPRVRGILLTHTHPDHAGGADRLHRELGAPVLVHPLELERVSRSVRGAKPLAPGSSLGAGDVRLVALHTPGHSPGHLCFHLPAQGILLTGDVVLGQGTTWVGPPEGNMTRYLATLEDLLALGPVALAPGHGPVVPDGPARIAQVRAHRLEREAQVLALLAGGPATPDELRDRIYSGLPPRVLPMATLTVVAHLDKLVAEGRVQAPPDGAGPYRLAR